MSDYCEVFLDSPRKARKPHKCCECQGIIQPKEYYIYSHGVFDGRGFSEKTCLDCTQLRSTINTGVSEDELCVFGSLYEYALESSFGHQFLEIKRKRKAEIPRWMLDKVYKI